MTITTITYTSKKTGAAYINCTELENGKFQLTSVEDPSDIITVSESTLKRWYKRTIEISELPDEPETKKPSTKASKKSSSKKTSKPRAKTYEEQNWGLPHQRISIEGFCALFDLASIEYDTKTRLVLIESLEGVVARRRAWENELTGSMWFRFQNHEFELTDCDYTTGVQVA